MFTREQLLFLQELLNTKGLVFPLDKCAMAASVNEALRQAIDKAAAPAAPVA